MPILLTRVDFDPIWISNHVISNVWDEININFQTSLVEPLIFENQLVTSSHTLKLMQLLFHVGN